MGDLFVKVMIVEYLVIALVYGLNHNWAKVLYFLSAALISVSVLMMK